MGLPRAGEQQPQKIRNAGERGQRASPVRRSLPLIDANRGRQPADGIYIRSRKLVEGQAAGGGQAFQKSALPLGKNRVDGQRTFAAATHPRQHDERIPRQVHIDIPQVVHPRSANPNPFQVSLPTSHEYRIFLTG